MNTKVVMEIGFFEIQKKSHSMNTINQQFGVSKGIHAYHTTDVHIKSLHTVDLVK